MRGGADGAAPGGAEGAGTDGGEKAADVGAGEKETKAVEVEAEVVVPDAVPDTHMDVDGADEDEDDDFEEVA